MLRITGRSAGPYLIDGSFSRFHASGRETNEVQEFVQKEAGTNLFHFRMAKFPGLGAGFYTNIRTWPGNGPGQPYSAADKKAGSGSGPVFNQLFFQEIDELVHDRCQEGDDDEGQENQSQIEHLEAVDD